MPRKKYDLTVYKNGSTDPGKFVSIPADQFIELLLVIASRLDIQTTDKTNLRLFAVDGEEIFNLSRLDEVPVVYISLGEEFVGQGWCEEGEMGVSVEWESHWDPNAQEQGVQQHQQSQQQQPLQQQEQQSKSKPRKHSRKKSSAQKSLSSTENRVTQAVVIQQDKNTSSFPAFSTTTPLLEVPQQVAQVTISEPIKERGGTGGDSFLTPSFQLSSSNPRPGITSFGSFSGGSSPSTQHLSPSMRFRSPTSSTESSDGANTSPCSSSPPLIRSPSPPANQAKKIKRSQSPNLIQAIRTRSPGTCGGPVPSQSLPTIKAVSSFDHHQKISVNSLSPPSSPSTSPPLSPATKTLAHGPTSSLRSPSPPSSASPQSYTVTHKNAPGVSRATLTSLISGNASPSSEKREKGGGTFLAGDGEEEPPSKYMLLPVQTMPIENYMQYRQSGEEPPSPSCSSSSSSSSLSCTSLTDSPMHDNSMIEVDEYIKRAVQSRIASADPIFSMSVIDKNGGLLQLVFELSKSKLEVFKYQIKSAKDILPLNLPKASDRMNFSSVTGYSVVESDKSSSTTMLKEQHISLNSQSGSFGFRLLHVCQLGPFADLVRLITTPDVHISQFFWIRPHLCLKKGYVHLKLKREDKKVYFVVTIKTLSIFLSQSDRVPIFSLPLPICELTKSGDKFLSVNAIAQSALPPLQFSFENEKVRDLWYLSMRKAVRIQPEEVETVIALQNDMVAHFGLAFEKAPTATSYFLRKLWRFLDDDEEYQEDKVTSEKWKWWGFQTNSPLTEIKRVGLLGLRHLLYFAERWSKMIKVKIATGKDSVLAAHNYGLASVGILVTDLMTSLVGLHPNREGVVSKSPSSFPIMFHNSLNPKMFDELFCRAMHLFDLIWDQQPKKEKTVEPVMALLKERLGAKLRQSPVHGGFEMLFSEEGKGLKGRLEKQEDFLQIKHSLTLLYPQLVYYLIKSDMYLAFAINRASPHSMSQGLSQRLMRLFQQNSCLLYNLLELLKLEISATLTGTTLFRENNVCTYMLTVVTKDLAKSSGYLERVIGKTVAELCQSGKEFDFSGRNKETPEVIAENQENVMYFVEKFFNNIIGSFDFLPLEFRMIANVLQTTVAQKFPECRHSIVGSFLFLRLLCPLIVTPLREWEGIPDPIPTTQKKGLVLMSKILQNISNGTFLREHNTEFVNEWLKKNQSTLQDFFDRMAMELPEDEVPPRPSPIRQESVRLDFEDVLHIHCFLQSHLLQVDEAIRTQLPIGMESLQDLMILLGDLPRGIEPFLDLVSTIEKNNFEDHDEKIKQFREYQRVYKSIPRDQTVYHQLDANWVCHV